MAIPTPTVVANPVRYSSTSNVVFIWVSTISNYTSPTSAEITAGSDMTAWLGKDSLSGFDISSSTITSDDIKSGLSLPLPDGRSIDTTPSVAFKRTKTTVSGSPQSVFTYNLSGYVVLCDAPTLATTGATIDIWPVTVGNASKTWSGEALLNVTFNPTAVPAFSVAVPTV